MSDIVAFIRARLDETEAAARAAVFVDGDLRWAKRRRHTDDPQFDEEYPRFDLTVRDKWARGDGHRVLASDLDPETTEHILRHDPARVLRDVEAKRRIVDQMAEVLDNPETYNFAARYIATGVLENLAVVNDQHPDYDEAWRP